MVEENKALVESSIAITRFDLKARNKLVVRGLIALSEIRDADFYFFKGEEHRIRDELEQALDDYQKALHIDPIHSDSLFFMGYCYLRIACDYGGVNDNFRRGIEALETLTKVRKKAASHSFYDYQIHYNLGLAREILGLYEEAIVSYEKAIELNPTHGSSYYGLGNAQYNLGLYKEAMMSYGQAIDLNPTYDLSYYGLGIAQHHLGLYKEAMMSFGQAIELNPTREISYYMLGNAQHNLGLYEEAIVSFGQATELNPQYCHPYYGLGFCQQHIGLNHQALENFEIYLSLNSDKLRDRVDYAKRMVELLKRK